MAKLVSRFRKDVSGATAIEYGLIAALVAVAIITGVSSLGNALGNSVFNTTAQVVAAK